MAACLHCKVRVANISRGLCRTCFYQGGTAIRQCSAKLPQVIKDLKGIPSLDGGSGYNKSKLPSTPTEFLPGTEAKIRVMAARAAMGWILFHPEDRTLLQANAAM
jgi:hypothetical protein